MDAFAIIGHSLKQVFGNLSAALRISLILSLVPLAASFALGIDGFFRNPEEFQFMLQMGNVPIVSFIVFLLISLVTAIWIAVAWHRYVLLGEAPGAVVPAPNGERMLSYLGSTVILVIIGIVLGFVIGLVGGFILSALFSSVRTMTGVYIAMVVAFVVIALPILVIMTRLSLVLPAAAVGKPLGLGGSWDATRGTTGTIVVVVIVLALASLALQYIGAKILPAGSIGLMIWTFVLQWLSVIVGLSVATTLYGHYVERRPLM